MEYVVCRMSITEQLSRGIGLTWPLTVNKMELTPHGGPVTPYDDIDLDQ